MTWQVYRLILRLHTPLHAGWGKVNYLQRTRPYLSGRVLRGALVTRLARNRHPGNGQAHDHTLYKEIGRELYQSLACTYFYPALKTAQGWRAEFSWENDNEAAFRRRFLSSYAGTALDYPRQTAAEGLLREIEFISPYTLDDGRPVYLMGYLFEKQGCPLDWRSAFRRLQLGGERGYGWGEARLEKVDRLTPGAGEKIELFDQSVAFEGSAERPRLRLEPGSRLLAHAVAASAAISGPLEPLVGREWRSEKESEQHIGQHLAFDGLCFAPGSCVREQVDFLIGKSGLWEQVDASSDPERL